MKDEIALERVMKALANRRRLVTLRILKRNKLLSVGDLAEQLQLSFKATSKHLAVLSAAGILDREQVSLNMLYSISADIPKSAQLIIELL